MAPLLAVLIGSLLAAGCLIGAFFNLHRKRIIDDLPTSKTQGVFIGLAELKGTAESEAPLTSYLAAIQCVQYNWQVEEHWRRTVTETYRDAQGNTRTRTKTESGWNRVADGGEAGPFYLKDDIGILKIVPEGAKIQNNSVFKQTVNRLDPLYYGKGPERAIANSTHERRFSESAIPLHAMLYVLGQSSERQDMVAAQIARDKSSPMFLISTRSEKQISSSYGRWFWFWTVLGLIVSLGAGVGWAALTRFGSYFNLAPLAIMGTGYLVIMLIAYIWTTYNNLINLHHRVEQGWSQVDVQLKRRYDLIPNLVHAVKGYRQYENETQNILADLRAQMQATPPGVSGPDYKGLARILQFTIERYPELKANESFLKLQISLVDCEQRIALARDYYNEVTTFYNTRLGIIPDRYVAALARLKERSLMSSADFERAPVEVKLVG